MKRRGRPTPDPSSPTAVATGGGGGDGGGGVRWARAAARWLGAALGLGDGRRNWWAEAALLAVAVMLELGVVWMIGRHGADQPPLGVGGAVLLGLGIAALPFRYRYPVGVLAVAFGTTLAYWSLGYTRGPIWLALIVALVQAVWAGRRRAAVVTLVAGFVGFPWLGYMVGRADRPELVAQVALAAWLVALISVAEAVRSRRERAAEAARSEAEALRRQITDERLRIARELHDVIAHNMSMISIQAGVALHLFDDRPEQARTSLAAIKEASKEALVELRSILGILRLVDEDSAPAPAPAPEPTTASLPPQATVPPVDGDRRAVASGSGRGAEHRAAGDRVAGGVPRSASAPRSPVPGLARLDDLVGRAHGAGLDVQVEVGSSVGSFDRLPRPVDLAAFRIVQESLTNVARHSDSPTATVRLAHREGGLAVEVVDEGVAQPRLGADLPRGGSGLLGMRERAAAVGGHLEAGPRPGRGFAVRAWFPLPEPPASEAARPEPTEPIGTPRPADASTSHEPTDGDGDAGWGRGGG